MADTPCTPACPVHATADILEHKWATLIVRQLLGGPQRYSALYRALPGISHKVLAQRLQAFEAQGLLLRTVYPTVPPSTDYRLTELGSQLHSVILAMQQFGLALQAAKASVQAG